MTAGRIDETPLHRLHRARAAARRDYEREKTAAKCGTPTYTELSARIAFLLPVYVQACDRAWEAYEAETAAECAG
jgi:hypothetical protein